MFLFVCFSFSFFPLFEVRSPEYSCSQLYSAGHIEFQVCEAPRSETLVESYDSRCISRVLLGGFSNQFWLSTAWICMTVDLVGLIRVVDVIHKIYISYIPVQENF